MNIIIKSLIAVAALTGAVGLTSCNEDFAQAPSQQPYPEIGTGVWSDPMQTWQAHLGTTPDGRTTNWVTGYIVGYVNSDINNTMASAVIADGETKAIKNNNVILAQYPYDEDEWDKLGYTIDDCIPVQLPSGVCRSVVNLSDHPDNFNRQVSLRGTTGSKYMGAYGLRSAYEYNWGAKGKYEEPITPIEGQYFCNFSASHDFTYYEERGWSQFMEKGGMTGFTVTENNRMCYVGMSAYYGTATGGPYINWLVSPALNLDNVEEKIVSFRTEVYRKVADTSFDVFVLTHKNPLSCEPVQLECPVSSTDGVWLSSGDIDLSEFSGKIYIAFRYKAERGGSGNSSDFYMTDFNFGGANPDEWITVDPSSIGTYRKADKLESGKKYAMLFDNEYVAIPATSGSGYGRLNVEEIEFTNEEETEFRVSVEDAFTFTNVEEDYWQIRDSEGRLIYMDDDATHSTFQFGWQGSYSDLQTSWKITESAGKYIMVSYLRGYHLEFNPSFMNVAPNSGNYVSNNCAVLFELVEE